MIVFGRSAARDPRTAPKSLAKLANSSNPDVVELVARNPSTPGPTLAALAATKAARTLIAVAGNPSTPADVLDDLVKTRGVSDEVKIAVAGNPSASPETLAWLPKSLPRSSAHVAADIRKALAGNRASSTVTRAWLFQLDGLRELVLSTEPSETVAARIALADGWKPDQWVMALLACDPSDEVRRAVAISPHVRDEVLDSLTRDAAPHVANVAIARRTADPARLASMAASGDQSVLAAVARNPATPADSKQRVARALVLEASDEHTLTLLARDESTPPETLNELATHASQNVRRQVVSNASAPRGAMQALASDAVVNIRAVAAANGELPLATIVSLATDSEPTVRSAVANNGSTPPEILTRLAIDAEPTVRLAVASNGSTPPDALMRLASDDDLRVVRLAAQHPQATAAVLQHIVDALGDKRREDTHRPARRGLFSFRLPNAPASATEVLMEVAKNPNTPREALRLLADSANSIRGAVAANPSSPGEVLEEIARQVRKLEDNDRWAYFGTASESAMERERTRDEILSGVVKNPSSSLATLEFLSDGDWVARQTATKTETGVYSSWQEWDGAATEAAKMDKARWVRVEITRRHWTGAEDSDARRAIAGKADTAPEILDELAKDADESVRRTVAANRSTPPYAFRRLAGDPAHAVRLAAASANHSASAGDRYARSSNMSWGDNFKDGFDLLAQDASPEIRATLVANSGAFWEVLSSPSRERLMLDPDARVRAALGPSYVRIDLLWTWSLSTAALVSLIDLADPEVWRRMSRNPSQSIPPEIWERLAGVEDPETQAMVAEHLPVDSDALVRLGESSDSVVIDAIIARWGVMDVPAVTRVLVQNPATPQDFLKRVARDSKDDQTTRLVLRNPTLPEDSLVELAAGSDERLLRELPLLGNVRVGRRIAGNPLSPIEVLESLAGVGDSETRQALILNEATPPSLLVRLLQSDHPGNS